MLCVCQPRRFGRWVDLSPCPAEAKSLVQEIWRLILNSPFVGTQSPRTQKFPAHLFWVCQMASFICLLTLNSFCGLSHRQPSRSRQPQPDGDSEVTVQLPGEGTRLFITLILFPKRPLVPGFLAMRQPHHMWNIYPNPSLYPCGPWSQGELMQNTPMYPLLCCAVNKKVLCLWLRSLVSFVNIQGR